jgi:hypothetical protein
MADALTTITKFINSPPGQLAAGGVLAGIVWKFFERVEAVLTDQTKLEIAVWLLGVKIGQKVEPWHDTFSRIFDRVFGQTHFSWSCFSRSCLVSYGVAAISILTSASLVPGPFHGWTVVRNNILALALGSVVGNVLPDFISLLETRFSLQFLSKRPSIILTFGVLVLDLFFTTGLAILAARLARWAMIDLRIRYSAALIEQQLENTALPLWVKAGQRLGFHELVSFPGIFFIQNNFALLYILPAFFTSIWLWLYAGSGFILKAARRFDIGFDWFNRKLDIEKHPLQSIGLVAGTLVAVVYWSAVIVSRFVGRSV